MHKISTKKNFGPSRKIFGSLKYEKKFWTHEIAQEKHLDSRSKIPTRKDFEPTKYPREKISDPRRHDGTRPARATIVRDPRNLAHSFLYIYG